MSWVGLVYIDGHRAQSKSVETFAELCQNLDIKHAVAKLRGCFFMIVRMGPATYCFTDNSGMYDAYRSSAAVSSSYLQLVANDKKSVDDIDPNALIEFLQLANVYFHNTHFQDIKKIAYDEMTISERSGELRVEKKNVDSIVDEPSSSESLIETFHHYKTAIEGIPTSVDATGGLDTRTVIAALAASGAEFETSISGYDGHPDVVLGKLVANAVGKPFFVTSHTIDNIESEFESVARSLDGLKGHLITQHRLLQYQRDRFDRGIRLTLKGLGGELFRDYIWVQDFPFYDKKTSDIEKMYRLRMEMITLNKSILTEEYRNYAIESKKNRLKALHTYRLDSNTRTYDNIHVNQFLQNAASRAATVSCYSSMTCNSPLAELHRLQYSFHQKRWRRFNGRYQRQFITECHRPLARVLTTYGNSASSEPLYRLMGSLGLARNYAKTLVRKVSQRYLNKTIFHVVPANHPEAYQRLINSEFAHNAMGTLKSEGIIQSSVNMDDVDPRFMESLLSSGWFLHQLRHGLTVEQQSPD